MMRPRSNTSLSTRVESASWRSHLLVGRKHTPRQTRLMVLLGAMHGTLAIPTGVHAQQDDASTEAERRFQDGLVQMKAGAYDVACPMLAESHRREPLLGVLFTLAECEAAWGKPATALEHYATFLRTVAAMALENRSKYDERREIAMAQVAALNATAPELTVDVAHGSPADLLVKLNGKIVPITSYGVVQKVDPGEYKITAERGDQEVWLRRIRITGRGRVRVEVRVAPPPSTIKPRTAATAPPVRESDQPNRTVAYFAGGVGLLGLAGGLVAGALALNHKQTVDENCPNLVCNAEGRRALDAARTEATLGTVGFTVAAVGAAAAGILWIAWPSGEDRGSGQSATWRGGIRAGTGSTQLTIAGAF